LDNDNGNGEKYDSRKGNPTEGGCVNYYMMRLEERKERKLASRKGVRPIWMATTTTTNRKRKRQTKEKRGYEASTYSSPE